MINAADKDTLSSMAETFAADYKDIVGNDISVVYGSESDVKAGDFYFALTAKGKGLKDEGYLSQIGDSIKTESETATGAYWATRTFLQILKQNKTTIPERNNQRLSKIQSQRCDPGCRTKSNRTSDRKRCCGNNVLVQDE